MQVAGSGGPETLTPRTGVEAPRRPEDTAGGVVVQRDTSRRDVLRWGLFGSLLAMLGGGVAAFLTYFWPRRVGTFGSRITLPLPVSEYPVGTVERIREGKFYLAHVPEGLLALYWKCAHLGCTVPWKPEETFGGETGVFHCPCHGSIYLRNGQNVAGPAPRPLDLMEVEVAGGRITVNTGKITQRPQWEPDQAVKV